MNTDKRVYIVERSHGGGCIMCSRRHIHRDDCLILKHRTSPPFQLSKNGTIIAVGGYEVMNMFEDVVSRWNNERSGWDDDGGFYMIAVVEGPTT